MVRRIALWAFCGLAIAVVWAAVFYMLGPSRGHYASQGAVLAYLSDSVLVKMTAPVALIGHHYAITWYWSAVINAAMYAGAGVLVEATRMASRWSRMHLHSR